MRHAEARHVVLAVEEEQALAHVLPQEREGVRRLQARVELPVDQQLGRGSGTGKGVRSRVQLRGMGRGRAKVRGRGKGRIRVRVRVRCRGSSTDAGRRLARRARGAATLRPCWLAHVLRTTSRCWHGSSTLYLGRGTG